ncbi:hypothetical protein CK203_093933 [Vitis vinifera]|uniref:Uncharacterized protein n=1 Tax=Vitis vinifera TaxID=29760 RepID=A0A438CTE0_VITVI|nr:hypothetical protein CK203_093933 [Vitis vinifera]
MANSNSRRNCLKKIKVRGIWLSDDQDIQRGVVRAYQDLLSNPGGWHPSISSLEFDRIGREEAARLEEMFSLEEVYLALSELNGDKAPGPDGFPIAFWQFFPKKGGAEDLRDFKPISLVVVCTRFSPSDAKNGFWGEVGRLDQVVHLHYLLSVLINGMEALSCLINKAVRGGFLSGCRLRERVEMGFNHFWSDINLEKSEIISMGRVENAEVLASELGCKVGSLPSTYLGLPLARSMGKMKEDGSLVRLGKAMGGGCRRKLERKAFCCLKTLPSLCVGRGLLGFYGGCGGWYPCFSRSFNDWELEAVASLLSVLQGKRLNVGMEDRVVWNASKNGIFSVKSLYNTLDSGGAVPFPWRIIWRLACLLRWVFLLGKLLGGRS